MRTDEEIEQYYESKATFLYENSCYAFESLIFYRKMLASAANVIENQIDTPESRAWMEEFERLERNEQE